MRSYPFFLCILLFLCMVSCHFHTSERAGSRDETVEQEQEKMLTAGKDSSGEDPLPVRGSSYSWNSAASGSSPTVSPGYTSTIYYEENPGVADPEIGDGANNRPLYRYFDHKEQFVVEPVAESRFVNRYGTEFIIPAHSLVYADGTPVTGKVHVSCSEFRTTEEIMLSGIPMKVTAGSTVEELLESAGMYDITAADEKGREVFLQNGENITVNIQAEALGDEYDIFRFEPKTGWITTDTNISVTASDMKKTVFRVRISEEEAQQYAYKQKSTFIYLDWPQGMYPEIEPLRDVAFELKERDSRTLYKMAYDQQQQKELYVMQAGKFNHNTTDKNATYVYFNGMDISFPEGNTKELPLSFVDTLGTVSGVMTPYYKNQNPADVASNPGYDRLGRQLEYLYLVAMGGSANSQQAYGELFRKSAFGVNAVFRFSGFGIWNCDRKILPGYNQSVAPVFVLEGQQVYPTTVSMVLSKNRSVFSQVFVAGEEHKLKYSSRDINLMYYAVNENTIAYVPDAYFKAIPGSARMAEIPLTQVSAAVFAGLLKNGELGISLDETAGK